MLWEKTSSRLASVLVCSLALLVGCGGEEKPSFAGMVPGAGGTGGAGNSTGGKGGVVTNAGGTGGLAGGGGAGGMNIQCPAISFVNPVDASQLGPANDLDMNCSNGFTFDVSVAVGAPDGTQVLLLADDQQVATGTVSKAVVRFAAVQLGSSGASALKARVAQNQACEASVTVSVACSAITCAITKPVISDTHPLLNGVATAQGGDRVSADGAPYQVAVEVTTNAPDGSDVVLTADNAVSGVVAKASGGVATFSGVPLAPDGAHVLEATCSGPLGQSGKSAKVTYNVDTAAPQFTLENIQSGKYFGPSEPLKACGKTTDLGALNLPATLGTAVNNFCVGIGTATPQCAPAVTGGSTTGDGACVTLACPGGAPFDLAVSLRDAAGNIQSSSVTSVSCASNLPSVQTVDPVAGTGSDVTTHILASNSVQARKDQNSGKSGAQYTVRACTDAAGGTGILLAGLAGGTLTQVGGSVQTVPAILSDNCPSALGNVLLFSLVDLPESVEASDGTLSVATEIAVKVTAISRAEQTSPPVQVWVDSSPPTFSPYQVIVDPQTNPPAGDFCNTKVQSSVDLSPTLVFLGTTSPVSLAVDRPTVDSSASLSTSTIAGRISGTVPLEIGVNSLSGTAQEPSGNTSSLRQPCTLTVGNPPIVAWSSPTGNLNKATDGDANTAGWQGNLSVSVNTLSNGVTSPATSGTVTFTVNGNSVGTVNIVAGAATLSNVTLPDGLSVALQATTSDIVPFGIGTVSSSILVDTVTPGGVSNLTAAVVPALRRQSAFQVSWTAPDDGGQAASGYLIKYWKSDACDASGFASGTQVQFGGTPAAPGATDGIQVSNLLIENNYCFGVQPTDVAGNIAPITVTSNPARAQFNVTVLTAGVTNDGSRYLDGSGDIDGDGYSDLLVGVTNGNAAYLYYGSPTGYSTTPDITFSGNPSTRFGFSAKVIGDVDKDGKLDLAVAAPTEAGSGKVYIFRGRANWRSYSTLTAAQADVVVAYDTVTVDPKAGAARLGISLASLRDFDGDGFDDFAIGATGYDAQRGLVVVVRGGANFFSSNVTLGAAFDPNVAYGITGEATSDQFGSRLLGFGKFYSSAAGSTLVVGAPIKGKVYTFTKPLTGLSSATGATHTLTGTAGATGQCLANVGPILGASALAVGTPGTTNDQRVYFGNDTVGPFGGTSATYTSSAGADPLNTIIGSGLPGSAAAVSYIGGSDPDAVIVSTKKLYFMRSADLQGFTGDIGTVPSFAPVVVSLPSLPSTSLGNPATPDAWRGSSPESTPIPDLNGDGYADVAVGEFRGSINFIGRVAVFW